MRLLNQLLRRMWRVTLQLLAIAVAIDASVPISCAPEELKGDVRAQINYRKSSSSFAIAILIQQGKGTKNLSSIQKFYCSRFWKEEISVFILLDFAVEEEKFISWFYFAVIIRLRLINFVQALPF